MTINSRLQKLEQLVPPPVEPKPDMSRFSIEELRFLTQHLEVYPDQEFPEDIQGRIDAICEKIVWR